MIKTTVFKDAVKSVLRISSAHNKGDPQIYKTLAIAQICIFQPPPPPELNRTLVYIHFTIANQKSVRYAFSIYHILQISQHL